MKNSKKTNRKLLMTASMVTSLIYIGWRIFFTIPVGYGIISTIAGIALVVSEAIGVLEAFSHYKNMSTDKFKEMPEVSPDLYPEVDVLISTHSEVPELLYKTVNGCIHMKYPDLNKVHIYICDDKNRPEMKQLAMDMGVGYFGMAENKFAKAGNLNNALSKTNSPLVATFDADMIPTSNFLLETVPYFFLPKMIKNEDGSWRLRTAGEMDENYKIGFIQTPQSFYNADLFQYNLFAERNVPNEQDYFFREINVGRNSTNSPIYAGSNTVISREALEDAGGIRTDTVTEDFATGIDIQAKGYTCYAIPKVLAHGLAPNSFKSLITQRQRWGRGCIQTLRNTKFLFGKLPLKAKMSYLVSFLYWWTFLRRFVYILSPILFTVFGIIVVDCSLWELALIWLPSYLIYNRSLMILSGNIRSQKWSNIVDTIIFPYMIIPIFAETFGFKLNKFAVTSKERVVSKNAGITYAIPHILLSAVSMVGLWKCIANMIAYRSYGSIILIYWLIVNLYFLFMAIVFMTGRVNYRSEERFYAKVDVEIATPTNKFAGVTSDISERGLAVLLERPEFIPYDTDVDLAVNYLDYHADVSARVFHVGQSESGWKYSFKITHMTEENKRTYFQIVFDREHTLPKFIHSGFVKDVAEIVNGRMKHSHVSNRKLPRVPLNKVIAAQDGRQIRVINYNYEYILLSGVFGGEALTLSCGSDIVIYCIPLSCKPIENATLCRIENWREAAENPKLREFLVG